MANVTINQLPAASAAQLTDEKEIWDPTAAAGSRSKKTTNAQDLTLFNANAQLAAVSQVTGLQDALDAKLALAGGTMTGTLTLAGNPTNTNDAANKGYVDSKANPLLDPITITAAKSDFTNADNGKLYRCAFATDLAVTFNNPLVTTGTAIIFEKTGTGNVNFVGSGGITIAGISSLIEPRSSAILVKTADTQWDVVLTHTPANIVIDTIAARTADPGILLNNDLAPVSATATKLGSSLRYFSEIYTDLIYTNEIAARDGTPITVFQQMDTAGITVPTSGGTASVLDYFESSSFTGTFTGPWASRNATVYFLRIGKFVILTFPESISATKTSDAFITMTGMPTRLRPATMATGNFLRVEDGGAIQTTPGWADIFSNGNFYIYKAASGTTFTGTGTCGIRGGNVCYSIQ